MLRFNRSSRPLSSLLRRTLLLVTLVGLGQAATEPAAAQNGFVDLNQVNGNIDVLENMVRMAEAAQPQASNQNVWSSATVQQLGGGSSSTSVNQLLSNALIQGGEAVARSERTGNLGYAQAWNNRFNRMVPFLQADMARMDVSQSIYKSNLRISYRNQAANARATAAYHDRQAAYAARAGNWAAASWHNQQAGGARRWAAWYASSAADLDNQ